MTVLELLNNIISELFFINLFLKEGALRSSPGLTKKGKVDYQLLQASLRLWMDLQNLPSANPQAHPLGIILIITNDKMTIFYDKYCLVRELQLIIFFFRSQLLPKLSKISVDESIFTTSLCQIKKSMAILPA